MELTDQGLVESIKSQQISAVLEAVLRDNVRDGLVESVDIESTICLSLKSFDYSVEQLVRLIQHTDVILESQSQEKHPYNCQSRPVKGVC